MKNDCTFQSINGKIESSKLLSQESIMSDLIKALLIFSKYLKNPNDHSPTHCEHDTFMIMGVTEEEVSSEDTETLDKLGFHFSESDDCWMSYRFGSA